MEMCGWLRFMPRFNGDDEITMSRQENRIGSLHGPRNDAWLNGTCPALLSGMPGCNSNSDVQLPYRFPITTETHSALCAETCPTTFSSSVLVHAAQQSQNA